jgi:acetyl esterase/lipase
VATSGADLGLMVADVNEPDGAYPIYQYGVARIVATQAEHPLRPLVWVSVGTAEGGPTVVELDAGQNHGDFVDIRGENEEEGLREVARRHAASILSIVPPPPGQQLGYLPDHEGGLGYAYTELDGDILFHVWDGKEWLYSPVGFDHATLVDVGEEPLQLVMAMPVAEGGAPSQLRFVNALSGEAGEVLLQDPQYDFSGSVFRDPASGAIVGAFFERNGPTSVWFDEGYREMQKSLGGYFPGRVVRLIDISDNGKVLLVGVSSDRDPQAFYTIDLEAKNIALLQSERPWLPGNRLSPTQIFKFTTIDGQKLDAYVTLPAGTTKENPAPLVVLPHGGPWLRSVWGFNAEAQMLASRGYAVLQPNYRGSTGYDWMFTSYTRVDLLLMHDDVTRAVRTLVKTGVVDPDRIAISGGGFGGYLAAMGLTEEPELYACGVTVDAVYDWQRLAHEIGVKRDDHPTYGKLFKVLGDPGADSAKYDAISPSRRAKQIKAPILIAREHGDVSLESKEAQEFIDDLLNAGALYQVHTYRGSLTNLSDQVELFDRMLAFLDQNLR